MSEQTADLARAVAGLMAIERRIIEVADKQGFRGLRFEWNDDIDFGHMLDPVPVNIFAPNGRSVDAEFSFAELSGFLGDTHPLTDAKINSLVTGLADTIQAGAQRGGLS